MTRPGVPATTVKLVVERATDTNEVVRCEVCGEPLVGVRGLSWSLHHRRGRAGRSDDHNPENLLVVCGGSNVDQCHGNIHSSRAASQAHGHMISRITDPVVDPAEVAVLVAGWSRWVYLTRDGHYSDDPEMRA